MIFFDNYTKGQIVEFESVSGYLCKGILYSNPQNDITVIHIHGSFGNFYDNMFIHKMGMEYGKGNVNLLSFNLQTHGGFNDGFIKSEYNYYGGALSKFETCYDDILGAINFSKLFSKRIVLQGHSMGTDRVLYFLMKSKMDLPFILLSPCDSYELQSRWIFPETVEEQIKRIKLLPDKDFNWLNLNEYGICTDDDSYPIPITKEAFLSLAEGFNFNYTRRKNIDYNYFFLDCKAFVYIGGKDLYQTGTVKEIEYFYKSRIKNVTFCFLEEGDHELANVLDSLIYKIRNWISTL